MSGLGARCGPPTPLHRRPPLSSGGGGARPAAPAPSPASAAEKPAPDAARGNGSSVPVYAIDSEEDAAVLGAIEAAAAAWVTAFVAEPEGDAAAAPPVDLPASGVPAKGAPPMPPNMDRNEYLLRYGCECVASPFARHLVCDLCKDVLIDPRLLLCANHAFCRTCISSYWDRTTRGLVRPMVFRGQCPDSKCEMQIRKIADGDDPSSLPCPPFLASLVGECIAQCCNCQATMARRDFLAHAAQCLRCTTGCHAVLLPSERPEHALKCPGLVVRCRTAAWSGCEWAGSQADSLRHHDACLPSSVDRTTWSLTVRYIASRPKEFVSAVRALDDDAEIRLDAFARFMQDRCIVAGGSSTAVPASEPLEADPQKARSARRTRSQSRSTEPGASEKRPRGSDDER